MPRARANGIELEYAVEGPADGPRLLLIMGIGQQMVAWPRALLDALAQAGLHTIRYDARDTGLSTHLDAAALPSLAEKPASAGRRPEIAVNLAGGARAFAPYTLDDMADDAAGLLDHLGIERAHVLGVSMGGMVAQLFAARHPARTQSLISVMSTTSEPGLPGPTPAALAAIMRRPAANTEAAVVAHGVAARRALGSPGYPTPDEYWAEATRAAYRRDFSPAGFARHLAAVVASGARRDILPTVQAPALVLHGADDPLVPAACGARTAELLPNARLEIVEGMGHDLAPSLCPRLAEHFVGHVRAHSTNVL